MCGRYTLAHPLGELVEVFEVGHLALDDWPPRFNIAPTQDAPVVVAGHEGERRMGLMRWGLVPHWAEDPSLGNRLINARSESARRKPAFRDAWQARRCLVPADGFYEWRKPPSGKGPRTPFHIHTPRGGIFALAGLWERWRPGEGGEPLHTFTLLTRDASPWMRPLHHRMPVLVPPEEWSAWLDRDTSQEGLERVLESAADPALAAHQVSTLVNRPGNDEAGCAEPLEGGEVIPQGSGGATDP